MKFKILYSRAEAKRVLKEYTPQQRRALKALAKTFLKELAKAERGASR